MIWNAIVFGDEAAVEPTPEWIRATLEDAPSRLDPFICLLRNAEDQMNAIATDGGFVLEWYRTDMGGHLAGFRLRDAPPGRLKRPGFFKSLFGKSQPIHGSRLSLEDAAAMMDAYVAGGSNFEGFVWRLME